MTCGIYEIVNKVNGKRYVGSSVDIEARWRIHRHHLRTGKHHSIALQRAWDKYGEASFDFKIIEKCSRDSLIAREQYYLDSGYDYNCSPTASSTLGVKRSDSTKEKCRNAIKEKWKDPEYREMIMSHRTKWQPSDEWRQASSERSSGANSGMFNPERITFCHDDHGCITETIWWFGKTFGLNKAHLRAIANGSTVRRQHKGWTLKKAP